MRFANAVRAILAALCLIVAAPAAAEAPPLAVYGGLPGVEDMSISPSGKGLAIVARLDNERRLMILGAGHKLQATVPLGDIKLRYIRWVGEDAVLLVKSTTEALGIGFIEDKHEFYNAILIAADGSNAQTVFAKRRSMATAIFGNYGARQINGQWTGYFGGIEFKQSADHLGYEFDHGRPALFAVDLKNNTPRKISDAASESNYRDWLVGGDGTVAAVLDINRSTGRWQIRHRPGTAIATGIDPTGDVNLISLGQDGTSVVYSQEDDAKGETHWYEVPLAGGTPKEVLADADIERIYVDPYDGRLLGYLQRGAPSKPVLFDPAQQKIITQVYRAFPKLDLRIVEWTPDFKYFLVHTSGDGDSGTWYVVDVAGRRADPLGYDYPQIAPARVGPVSTVTYQAADGLEMDGVLTLPPGNTAKNLPIVVLPHGGPTAYDPVAFDWWAQAFASRGYAVFQPNFRGSTNRGDAFRRAGNGQWGRKMQSDISDGLAALAKQGIVDAKRACIVGASYGGYAALAGVTLQHGLYRCAVAVAPVSDLSDMYQTDLRESGGSNTLKNSLRESLGTPTTFAEVSPRKRAAQADAPILLIHGKDDTVVPFKQSSAMADALKDAGKPYELVVMANEDHWLSRSATRKQMLEAAVAFVEKNNPAN